MKILFDHQVYNEQNYGGISRYFYELGKGLKALGTEVGNSVLLSDNVYINDPLYSVKFQSKKSFKGKTSLYKLINQINSNICLKHDFDVFHPTHYETYFFKKINKPFVITFYDLIHEKYKYQFPELGQDDSLFDNRKMLLEKSAKVIAISESTKNDIIKIYDTKPEKIEVIYLSNSLTIRNEKLNNNGKYILYVGNRNLYKNFVGFVKAISSFLLKNKDIKLICAGGGNFDNHESRLLVDLKIISQVVQKPINDDALTGLYINALFFVFPSLYEGFGIPVLEAFSCGCPALISNTSSLPEVGGDAAMYFDPESADDMLDKVTELFYNDVLRNDMQEKGFTQNKKFSWANTAEFHNELYKSLL